MEGVRQEEGGAATAATAARGAPLAHGATQRAQGGG